jgi:monothiol glutaredoxin
MSLDADTRNVITGVLSENPVVLFMKGNRIQPRCGFSAKSVAALDMLLPDYVAIDVLQHAEIREGIKEYGNWPTIPQLYVRGELVGGSDIIQEMFSSGELADLLGVKRPVGGTPRIDVEPAAAASMTSALASNTGMAIHLKIDAGWEHSLSLAPPGAADVVIRIGDGPLALHLDPWSAARADGLRIASRDSLQGTGFSFENPQAPPPVSNMEPDVLKTALEHGKVKHVVDVRGDDERSIAALPGAMPWSEETMRAIDALDKDTTLVFFCHKGGRSLAVAERYRRRGYTRLFNLQGGIDAWAQQVDPSLRRY